VLRLFAHAG